MKKKILLRALFVRFQGIIQDELKIGGRGASGGSGMRVRHKRVGVRTLFVLRLKDDGGSFNLVESTGTASCNCTQETHLLFAGERGERLTYCLSLFRPGFSASPSYCRCSFQLQESKLSQNATMTLRRIGLPSLPQDFRSITVAPASPATPRRLFKFRHTW